MNLEISLRFLKVSESVRSHIAILHKEGLSHCQTTAGLQVSKGAVYVTLKHFAETESVVSEARSDRPNATTLSEDQYIKLPGCCVCVGLRVLQCVYLRWCKHNLFWQISCDLSMTRSALIGWACLPSRLLASCSGWPRLRTPSLCWEGRS